MATEVIANPPAAQSAESKSARKKKAKAEAAAAIPIPTEQPASELGANSSDVAGKSNGAESENSYIKELQKCAVLFIQNMAGSVLTIYITGASAM